MIHIIVTSLLLPSLIAFALIVGYIFGLRPVLKQTPAFKELYATEDTLFSAINVKLGGLKQKIVTVFVSIVGFVVIGHDSLSSLLAAAGIDPIAYGTQILPKVPSWAWPLITLAAVWLIQYFRNLADKQAHANAVALLDAGRFLAAPAPGLPVSTLPSPFLNKKDA
jgi:hypothetical protein